MILNDGFSSPRKAIFVASDPRVLMFVFSLIAVCTFLVPHSEGLLVLFLYVVLLHRICHLPARGLLVALRNLSLFLVFIILINAFLVKGEPLPAPFSFFSREGIVSGVYYCLRVLVLSASVLLYLSLTSPEGIASAISAFLKPISSWLARRVAFYAFISIGFLPLFADETRRISIAQKFRGGGLEGGLRQKLVGVRLLLVPLILSAIHRSGQLAMTVELRGVRSSIERLFVLEKPAARDYRFAVVSAAVVLVVTLLL